MRILFLTQYFPPEVGAPQNRLFELAVRLKRMGADIEVLTAMPNYPQMRIYEGYRGKFYKYEETEGLKIHRAYIYSKKSRSIVVRLLNYFSFVITSFFVGWFKLGRFDWILCESPPLFLGLSAYGLKKLKRSRLIFNVSDLWPESAEKLGLVSNPFLLSLSTKLEEFLYRNSELITGQTQGIVSNISSRFPQKRYFWLRNGVDISYYQAEKADRGWRAEKGFRDNDFIILYAGIIGHAQGLEVILKAASRLRAYERIKFVLIGEGPEKEKLLHLKDQLGTENVFFLGAATKSEMPGIISSADAAVIPLKKLDLFRGAIPSKIFENLAMKKPVLLGVEGEAKQLFIEEGSCGLAFVPENDEMLAEQTLKLYESPELCAQLGENGLKYVKANFSRDVIADNFWKLISSAT
jgi:glycosyltransferase involved in cell wall biosynthesis